MSAPEWIGTQVQVIPDLERGGWKATAYEADNRTVRRSWNAPTLAEVRDLLAEAGVFSVEQALQVEARVISLLREMGYRENEVADLIAGRSA